MIRNLLTAIFLLAVCFVAGSFFLPSKWRLGRSIVINAPAPEIYPYLATLKNWPQWSAFDSEDSNIQVGYSGQAVGEGAVRSWTSKKLGDGRQTITAADENGIEYEIVMLASGLTISSKMSLTPVEGGTLVQWASWGTVGWNPFHRWKAFFVDRLIGPMVSVSLETLKDKVE